MDKLDLIKLLKTEVISMHDYVEIGEDEWRREIKLCYDEEQKQFYTITTVNKYGCKDVVNNLTDEEALRFSIEVI